MDLTKLRWIKNVKPKDNKTTWAYAISAEMQFPDARIFSLNWRNSDSKADIEKPCKGDLMLLLQRAKITHVVEVIDDGVYGNDSSSEWSSYRIVKVVWMAPENKNWWKLPNQKKFFGYPYVLGDGAAHDLVSVGKMPKFHQYWDDRGGLEAFRTHLSSELAKAERNLLE